MKITFHLSNLKTSIKTQFRENQPAVKTALYSLLVLVIYCCSHGTATAQVRVKDKPRQSFNSGWQFTAQQLNAPQSLKPGKKRGLGKNWQDQFNVQTVNQPGLNDSSVGIKTASAPSESLSSIKLRLKAAQWQPVTLPHSAFIEPVPIENPKEGYAYYKKAFKVPAKLKGKVIRLQFGAAMQIAEIWVNGQFVKRHLGGYLPFSLELTDKIRYGKVNTLFVKLDNRPSPILPPGKPVKKLDFIYYSGLYRNTWLLISDPLHITSPEEINKTGGGGVFAHYLGKEQNGQSGTLKIRTNIMNADSKVRTFKVRQQLQPLHPKRQAAASSASCLSRSYQLGPGQDTTIMQILTITRPRQWSPDTPNRYTLKTSLEQAGTIIHQTKNKIGLRTLQISKKKGVVINGQPIHIVGSNRHMNYPWIGNSLSDNANIRDAVRIKKAGINALRLAHYPQAPAFYDACDSLGILLIDCIPGWQFYNKAKDFKKLVMRDIRQMIRRDRNHPAIFLWETSLNEAYPPAAFRVKQAKVAHKEWQDSTGFYTSGDSYFTKAAWDVPYDDWNGDPGDRNNTTYPEQPFLIREYGDYEFGGGQSTSRKSRADGQQAMLQQAWNLQWEHNRNQKYYPRCIGDMTWAFYDGLAGLTNSVEYWGLADLYRIPKFAYYFFQSQQKKRDPMIFIANYWTNIQPEKKQEKERHQKSAPNSPTKKVIIYSNCDSVSLFVNDKLIATRQPDSGPDRPYGTDLDKGGHPFTGGDVRHLNAPPFTFKEVKYIPGALKAVGYRHGQIRASQVVYTPGRPVGLRLHIDDQNIALKADGADAVFIRATLIDSAGHPVYIKKAGDKMVHFSLQGPGKILSPKDRKTAAGIASILVQSTTKKAKLRIQASAAGLKSDEITYQVQ